MPALESRTCPECHECIVYTGEHSHCMDCPKCGEERINAKWYSVVPFIPRLRKVFQSPSLTKLSKYHATRREVRDEDDSIFDIQDTEFWLEMFNNGGPLYGDPRNLLLSFNADRV